MRVPVNCIPLVFLLTCASCGVLRLGRTPDSSALMRFDLRDTGRYSFDLRAGNRIEFSADSRLICVSWQVCGEEEQGWNRVVLDVNGVIQTNAVAGRGRLQPAFLPLFPATACRLAALPQFSTNYAFWAVDAERQVGVGLSKHPKPGVGFTSASWTADFWALGARTNCIWRSSWPEQSGSPVCVDFLREVGNGGVLVAFEGRVGYLLSLENGRFLDVFHYGDDALIKDVEGYKRRNGLSRYSTDDSFWEFDGSEFAYDACHNLLACGPHYSRKVRVLSMVPPYAVVWEAHADEGPLYRNKVWKTERVDFQGDRYLVVESFCERAPDGGEHVAEVYDVPSWRRIWSSEQQTEGFSEHRVSISPDGKKIAYFNAHYVEIAAFPTNAAGAPRKTFGRVMPPEAD